MKPNEQICSVCGCVHTEENGTVFDNEPICNECLERETVICRHCGRRIWRNDAVDGDLCMQCYEDYYICCTECDAVIHMDDAYYPDGDCYHDEPYCHDCYYRLEDEDKAIHDYYYKPAPLFYGGGKRYYGVELEIDDGGEYDDNARALLDIANHTDERIYIKHDSSIDDGFEIVSHPMTLDYHQSEMPWEDVMRKAIRMGYISHQAGTCGLHVHINRNSLGDSYEAQECTIAKILYFYEKFWDEILRFSRRTNEQVNHWARRYGGGLISPRETLKHAKSAHLGRYVAVNLENCYTIEMRIFRGSLKYSTFIATLQFVDSICNAAFSMSDEELQRMTWLDFVEGIPSDKQELIDYLKSRRLYVNEPVADSEEV